jgi:hypothetical protein
MGSRELASTLGIATPVALATLLTGHIWSVLQNQTDLATPAAPESLIALATVPIVSDRATSHRELLTRPLFFVTRRPFVAPVTAPASPESSTPVVAAIAPLTLSMSPPAFRLAGVVGTGSTRMALLMSSTTTSMEWVRQGDMISGWTVKNVQATSVAVIANGVEHTLSLYPAQ